MKASTTTLSSALAAMSFLWGPAFCDITQGTTPTLFARLDRMASLSMNVYTGALCGAPAGFSRAGFINETTYDIQGQVLRDDAAREAVVVFRGTASDKNFQVDLNVTLAPFETAAGNCAGCSVHGGFYLAWAAAREQVLGLVQGVLGEFPGYGVVITGHSLGGSMASLAATQFQPLFPNLTVYTFGEPRTGDALYVQAVENNFLASSPCTTRYFRSTREYIPIPYSYQDETVLDEDDGVPNFPAVSDGYQSSTRNSFWQRDPVGANNTFVCTSTSDFQTQRQCGEGRNGSGINEAHLTYFGHPLNTYPLEL
ncbi:putative feruloyl esterase a [Diaporthe ampelina]|uniref:Putative feruloyl esterase a n=1 Tax=Diaporthe ampelina TaxID=1214573 RepID=A0A0G2FBX5_9PEZI|nr:putative feruloyl esterase a [Diaporthe ampelina]